ncbi:bidirectional sugar transporter SWEET16-like, partial [Fagus crenata]
VPNVVGFVLGAIQLIIYTIYKNKSKMLAKSTDLMKEEGPKDLKNRRLNKGTSMPKQQVDRQYSMPKIIKTLSFGPHELNSSLDSEDNVEIGEKDHP